MWWSYSDARERKDKLRREIARRQKRGETFTALEAPKGNKLSKTFWGQAWCRNLESYQVYENRLPRGRSYLRQGNVYNLKIEPGQLRASVAGSEFYDTRIHIQPLSKARWRVIQDACAGQVNSMLDLLAGRLGEGVMAVLTDRENGLFPKPKEIRFDCSCPDYADMCKHVSAVLYGVGVLLDEKPELLFTLRGVDQAKLLSQAGQAAVDDLGSGGGDLAGADLSALFGIDLGDPAGAPMEAVSGTEPARKPARKRAGGKAAQKTGAKAAKRAKKTARKRTRDA